jgi:hypothetical protein
MVVLAWAVAAMAKPPPTWTVETLVQRNQEARGGASALASISTLKETGTMLVNGGATAIGWTRYQQRPGHVREELSLQGFTQISAWDGSAGWSIDPFEGRRDPVRMSPEDAKGLIQDAAIDGALLTAKANGWPMKYLGVEDIDGTPAHKVQIDEPNGDQQLVWLDPDWFLEIRVVVRRTEHGALVEGQTDFGDYEKVNGVYFPLLLEIGPRGASSNRVKIQLDHAEANVAMTPDLFAFPEGK